MTILPLPDLSALTAPVPADPAEVIAASRMPGEWQLTETEMRLVLVLAGWPGTLPGEVIEQALRVAWGESRWSPEATGDRGLARGLWQIRIDSWLAFCGVEADWLYEPVTNARCALAILEYEAATGGPLWRNWAVQP